MVQLGQSKHRRIKKMLENADVNYSTILEIIEALHRIEQAVGLELTKFTIERDDV